VTSTSWRVVVSAALPGPARGGDDDQRQPGSGAEQEHRRGPAMCGTTFESDEELEEFLAFTYAERHRDLD